jgi:hypothetical protein
MSVSNTFLNRINCNEQMMSDSVLVAYVPWSGVPNGQN